MICFALLAYILMKYDALSVFSRLLSARADWLVVAVVLIYAARLVSSSKWKSILHSYGHQASLLGLYRLYIETGFFNLFFPGFIAGDASRVARTSVESRVSIQAFMAVVLERFSGLMVVCVYIGLVLVLGGYEALDKSVRSAIVVSILLVLSGLVLLLKVDWVAVAARFLPDIVRERVREAAGKAGEVVRTLVTQPMLLWNLISRSLLFIVFMVGVAYCISRSINFLLPLSILFAYVPLIALLVNLPISITGIGVRENLFVLIYSELGFLPEGSIAFALLYSALLLGVNLSGGLLILRPTTVFARKKVEVE